MRSLLLYICAFTFILSGCSSRIQLGKHNLTPQASTPEQKQLIDEGISAHDQGKYGVAIQKYEDVLALNPGNTLALYELSFLYFTKQDWQKSLDIAIRGTSYDSPRLPHFYIAIGNNLNSMGRPDEAIAVFNEALGQFSDNFMLHYNLGVTYYHMGDIARSKTSFKNAVLINPAHSSSHIGLGNNLYDENNDIVALMAYCRFLILEPASQRSSLAQERVLEIITGNVIQDSSDSSQIHMYISPDMPESEGDFRPVRVGLTYQAAWSLYEQSETKEDIQIAIEIFDGLFKIISEHAENDKKSGFGWEYYVPYFVQLHKDGFVFPFVQHIFQYENLDEPQISEFLKWSEDYYSGKQ